MRSGPRCFYCDEPTVRTLHHSAAQTTRDHVVPLSLGGVNVAENIVVACGWCNRHKGELLHHEWVNMLAGIELPRRDLTYRRKASAVLARWEFMVVAL